MRVAEKRNAVRLERQNFVNRDVDARNGLMRKPIYQIGVQRGDACRTKIGHACPCDLKRLQSADGRLNDRVEVLNADGGTRHALRRQCVDFRTIDHGRIDLHRELEVVRW